jgi:GTPase Era involved in 16S rRNA processing
MSQYQENIHIAILGPVSAGKSTFLNALLSNTYSDMMRKKTTMLPQIYQTTYNEKEIDSAETIKEKNRKSNEDILKLRESGQYNDSHFKELTYKVKPIDNFIVLPDKKCTYNLCDMPGLNCSGGGDVMYYNYLEKNSHKIDIYILVFDINSALNTTDEVKILQEVNKYIQKNKHGYVHILVNKCDYVEFDDKNEFKFTDDELNDLYKRVREIVDKNINNLPNKTSVSISPICSSDLYIYRAAINNIESLDENQLDDIIKKECGKREFLKLQKEGIDKKRKYIKGLIKDKKTDINDWMKDTGYNLFIKSIQKILNNYQQIILYHIEQDVNKILVNIQSSQINFDKVSDNLGQINMRLRNLIQTYNDKCKVEEIIPKSIKTKLDEITQLMNNYIISGINTFSANTIENADSFLDKITKFFGKVSNIFKTNPLVTSQDKLKIKRFELLNNKLSESFNEQIFTELYTTKQIDLSKYTTCVANTIDKNLMKFDKLLELIKKITNSDKNFMNVIINKFTSSYKSDTKFTDFLSNLELISNSTNNNLDVMWSIIECQLKVINNDPFYQYYNYWINLNSVNILNQTDEIKYLMFKINRFVGNLMLPSKFDRFDTFKEYMNNIQNMYNLLSKLIGKKPTNIINDYEDFNDNKSNKSTKSHSKQNKLLDMQVTDDEFLDATEGEKTETEIDDEILEISENSEMSDEYNDSDDSDTVFRKATKNTSVRTTKRVNKGSKNNNLTK